MPDSRSRRLEPLKQVVQNDDFLLFEQIRRRTLDLAPIVRIWHQAVPEPLRHHARPVLIQGRTLTVWTDSPVWTHSLRHALPSITLRLRELGPTEIDNIEIRQSPADLPRDPEPGGPTERDTASAALSANHPDVVKALSRLRKALEQPE